MSCNALPSEHLVTIRERLKDYVHGGKFFTSDEVTALIRRVNSIVALAEEVEEENRLLGRALQASGRHHVGPILVGGNVLAFPGSKATASGDGGNVS
jgi:hypothetical protein